VPTNAGIAHYDPITVYNLLNEKKCLLVDLRGDDQAAGLIKGAVHEQAITTVPFKSRVPELCQRWADVPLVIFTCQYSAHRAPQCANWYREQAHPRQQVGILSGGFRGWESVGLPVEMLMKGNKGGEADSLAISLGMDFLKQVRSEASEGNQNGDKCDGKLSTSQTGTHVTTSNDTATPSSTGRSFTPSEAPSSAVAEPVQQVSIVLPTPPTFESHKPTTLQSADNDACRSTESGGGTRCGSVVTSVSRSTIISRPNYVEPELTNRVPTIKNVEHLDPVEVQELMQGKKCLLVDVRGEDRASGLIEGSVHEPAFDPKGGVSFPGRVSGMIENWKDESLIVFTCQYSAHRAPQCANWYREKAPPKQRVAIMSMGFRGWEGLGLPIKTPGESMSLCAADAVAQKLGKKFVDQCLLAPKVSSMIAPSFAMASSKGTQLGEGLGPAVWPATSPSISGRAALKPTYMPPFLPNRVPTLENVEHVDPGAVQSFLQSEKCLLVDVRGEDRSTGVIQGALHEPAIDTVPFPVRVPKLVRQWADKPFILFFCQYSAHRAPQCANWYRTHAPKKQRVGVLAGGFRGWESLGLPVKPLTVSL